MDEEPRPAAIPSSISISWEKETVKNFSYGLNEEEIMVGDVIHAGL